MLDRELRDANDAEVIPPYPDGTDQGEDIDEAALRYVLECKGGNFDMHSEATPGFEYEEDSHEMGGSSAEPATGGMSDGDGSTSSWRETIDTDDAKTFKRQRAQERNMRSMSGLWNRLFPIDYDALPLVEYEVIDAVPQIASLSASGDALQNGVPSLERGIASAAVTSGLNLEPIGIGTEGENGIIQSDTSNDDTVMIGNSALSDILTQAKLCHDSAAAPDQEPPVGNDAMSSEMVPDGATNEERPIPEELTSLYNNAMDMLSSIDENQTDDGQRDGFEEAEDDLISQMDLDDVSMPADGDIVESDSASNDYRGDQGPDIYESDEWKEIQNEIEQSEEALKAGLEHLDFLANVSPADDTSSEREPDTNGDMTDDFAAEENEAFDGLDFTDESSWENQFENQSEIQPEAEGEAVAEQDDRPSAEDDATNRLQGSEGSDIASYEEAPAATDSDEDIEGEATEAPSEQSRHAGLLSRLFGMFKRDSSHQTASDATDEDQPDVAFGSQAMDQTRDTAEGSESPDETDDEGVLIGIGEPSDAEDADARASEQDETRQQEPTPDVAVSETKSRHEDGDEAEWNGELESLEESDDDVIAIGEDYREDYRNEVSNDFQPDDADTVQTADEIMQPEEGSEDYRKSDEVDQATVPMPADDMPDGKQEQVPEPQQVTQLITQRPMTSNGKTKKLGTGKSRLRSLEIDASPELMLPLPTSRNGQVDANIRVKTTEFLNPKRLRYGARSSHVKLSVRPSKVRMDSVIVLPVGGGYIPESSPVGRRIKEQGRYEYEPIRRIGEPLNN